MVKFSSLLIEMGIFSVLFGPQIDFLEPKNIFFWCLKCFKSASDHISHGIDQNNGWSSEFLSLNRPQMSHLARSSPKLALFGTPNWLSRAPKYIFLMCKILQIYLWPHSPWYRPEKMFHQVSSLDFIALKWSNLAHSLPKWAYLDPFLVPAERLGLMV